MEMDGKPPILTSSISKSAKEIDTDMKINCVKCVHIEKYFKFKLLYDFPTCAHFTQSIFLFISCK
jgi:hypothetical protein